MWLQIVGIDIVLNPNFIPNHNGHSAKTWFVVLLCSEINYIGTCALNIRWGSRFGDGKPHY